MFLEFAIIAPTASGKSELALHLASKFNAVILSLDSLSVYKQIDIASAKPSKEELKMVKHFGIDLVYPNKHFSVGDFITEYQKAKIYAQNLQIPLIITGGSGFYLKAMMSGLSPKIQDVKQDLSNEEIYNLALKIDKEFANNFSKNDSYRLLKWYSIYKTTNEIPTLFLKQNLKPPVIQNLKIYEIFVEREILRKKIEARTKSMIKSGLIDEAKFLFDKYTTKPKSLNSIGLKECASFLRGEISLTELENLISTHTAQLAKRQRTFNKSQFKDKISLSKDELKAFLENLLKSHLK
ncbi:tRNA (adenosine(37)-N6)-dimethylallyltransferase MiaA [Campylobacter sp. FMV-PI01]|uniref:tRNA dimethylallyltransferase n=1 Tax=Campylobacter portucalensis TaxID=2608384 RepID=A0A6L5WFR6_9BACT|nr:tRNA (adenosine(37)-N6)-dimethylallyltransferase MiaA [Campylobacter portucalensis]MSN95709.1 tRNA (adenosine(37)-N6)-dimethylallyltransferase MiaA [Campylobacter portucalensis]